MFFSISEASFWVKAVLPDVLGEDRIRAPKVASQVLKYFNFLTCLDSVQLKSKREDIDAIKYSE